MALEWRPIQLTQGLAGPRLRATPACPGPARAGARAAVAAGELLYRCGLCGGTGAKPRRLLGRPKCPICQGRGAVALPVPVVTCAYCRGIGQTRRGAKVFCTICHGKGLVSVAEPFETCPECDGSGATPTWLPCIRCKGTGVVAASSDGQRPHQAPQQGLPMISLREWKKTLPAPIPVLSASPGEEQVQPTGVLWKLEKPVLPEQSGPPRLNRAAILSMAVTLRAREKRAMFAGLRRSAKPWWQPGPERVPAGLLRSGVYHCAFCRGSGQSRGRRTKCPSCAGTGIVRVKPPVVRCALCHGRGRANDNLHLACLACKGKGIHPVEEPLTRCPRCQGTGGWGAIPCTECGGKGVITERAAPGKQAEQLWQIDNRGMVLLKTPQPSLAQEMTW